MARIVSRLSLLSVAFLVLAPSAAFCDPATAQPAVLAGSSSGACFAIAEAKVREWNQAKLFRDRMDTMADGKLRPSVMIFTENGMFEQVRGLWRTGQALRNQRVAGPAESVMKRMGLSDCSSAGMDDVDGQKAAVYTYAQDPDIKAKIWISDSTGLPLRVELQQSPGRDNNPVKVSMRYAYNDDVHVPRAAGLRNWVRMKYSQDWLNYMATGTPGTSH
jgi:hypothetical protein